MAGVASDLARGVPRFSLVTACRNGADYVARHLRSIAEAAGEFGAGRVQAVFVDDGSSDGSAGAAEREGIAVPGFTFVPTGAADGSGCGGARNRGLAAATGEYVWYLDVDDWIAPDSLRRIDEAISGAGGADACVFPYETHRPPGSRRRGGVTVQSGVLERAAFGPVSAWSKVFRRTLAVPFAEGVWAQDCAWHFRQFDRFGSLAAVAGEAPCYHYDRLNQSAVSNTQEWTVDNPRTLEQLAMGGEACAPGLKDRFISDSLRSLADMYDARHALEKPWVRAAWAARFRMNCANVFTGRFTQ